MRPVQYTYAPTASDADGIALSQTPAGAGAITLNGVLVTGGVAVMGAQQFVTITSAGNISDDTFTLVGTDFQGNSITEALTGPNATTVVSTKSYKTVTSITTSSAAAAALTIGVNGLGDAHAVPLDMYPNPFNVGIAVVITGSPTYTVQHTFDNPFASSFDPSTATWFNHDDSGMVGATTNQNSNYSYGCRASRVRMTAGSGATLVITYTQAGLS